MYLYILKFFLLYKNTSNRVFFARDNLSHSLIFYFELYLNRRIIELCFNDINATYESGTSIMHTGSDT